MTTSAANVALANGGRSGEDRPGRKDDDRARGGNDKDNEGGPGQSSTKAKAAAATDATKKGA